MAVEQFTKEQFEASLPKLPSGRSVFTYYGPVQKEHCYIWQIGYEKDNRGKLRILLRSSIKYDSNLSGDSGKDSIRLIIEQFHEGQWIPIGKGADAYTNRLPVWQKRLRKKIKYLYYKLRPIDQSFGDGTRVFVVRTNTENRGRLFIKEPHFKWLTPLEN